MHTDEDVLEELKRKERKKVQEEAENSTHAREKTQKGRERPEEEDTNAGREHKNKQTEKEVERIKRRGRKQQKVIPAKEKMELMDHNQSLLNESGQKGLIQQLESLSFSPLTSPIASQDERETESEAECPKCGLIYGEDDSLWIQCDSCELWWDFECIGPDSKNIRYILL